MHAGLVLPYDIQALSIKYAWTQEMKINFGNVLSLFSPLRSLFDYLNMPSSAFVSCREFIIVHVGDGAMTRRRARSHGGCLEILIL